MTRIWEGMTNQEVTHWYCSLDSEKKQKLEAHLSEQELAELAERVVLGALAGVSPQP